MKPINYLKFKKSMKLVTQLKKIFKISFHLNEAHIFTKCINITIYFITYMFELFKSLIAASCKRSRQQVRRLHITESHPGKRLLKYTNNNIKANV